MKNKVLLLAFLSLLGFTLNAQPKQSYIKVTVALDHNDWCYSCGEKPKFNVSVQTCWNAPVENVNIKYEIAEDGLAPLKKGNATLKDGTITFDKYTMTKPGFLRCRVWAKVDGYTYDECATAAFEVDKLVPKTIMPDDFDKFWGKAIADSKKIDMLPLLKLVPSKCTSKVDVYSASFQNFQKGSRIYGTLCVPHGVQPHSCPAILIVPGAGCRSRKGFYEEAEKGYVTFEVGIHGIPTVMEDESIYTDLKNGSLLNYPLAGIDDKDNYYYKRVFVGCARAVDFLSELEWVNPEYIGVTGGSQGGALTITTAALNPKIKCAAPIYPAMCDLTGYLYDQGNAWPYIFKNKKLATKERLETVQYYDVANFARKLSIPVFFSYGYNDLTVCPTSVAATYNIVTAPKERMVVPQSRHYTYSEQWKARSKWMMEHLKIEK